MTFLILVSVFIGTFGIGTSVVHAFPWGGRFNTVIPCWNSAIFTATSGPRGGLFIWTPVTKTYQFGAPSHAGQYGIGLAGPPYICIVSPYPVLTLPGIMMTMLGTSK